MAKDGEAVALVVGEPERSFLSGVDLHFSPMPLALVRMQDPRIRVPR